MEKKDLKKLALLGLSTGLIVSHPLFAASNTEAKKASETSSEKSSNEKDNNDGNLGYHVMTEDEIMLELNADGVAMYKNLSSDGKGLALLVASMRCNGTNPCKGLNSCKTDKNDCAGKGSCKNTGKCGSSDKNLAVKLVYNKMMGEKRAKALNN